MNLYQHLSKRDAIRLLEILQHGLECRSEEDFRRLILDLRELLGFECAVGGYQNIREILANEEICEQKMVNVGYPVDFLDWYYTNEYHLADAVLLEFLRTFEVQNWADVTKRCLGGKKDRVTLRAEEFGLKDGFAYGVQDFNRVGATCFFFAGDRVENDERSRTIIKYAVPHLSEALKRLLREKTRAKLTLTQRELEVLKWLKDGKSSWDISRILGRSESVINFHVRNIVRKLDAMNRTHAVAIAVEHGLVEW
ncbi:MAG: autoinducer binding domain-containing protein [Deltaproteobacteria bacterium]|nr:autoinducer binding domain-containing protein [Deltaproteobacteria bacterium]MBW2072401.1 autoinducer binding domain-containing protein [Deltaproteobacteria bacterium]